MTSAAILAGGRARRLDGRDKSTLHVDGRSILDRQLDALESRVNRVFLVGARTGNGRRAGLVVIPDRVADSGPLAGLDAALAAADPDDVLLLACDMPFITGPLIEHLIGKGTSADAVVPRTDRGYHPLCAVYRQSCRTTVRRRLMDGHLAMRDLLEDLCVLTVGARELECFGAADHLLANVNTQADLDALGSLSH
jgi:molybdopterin-guanine dinucleotide biosynthesis protein A